MNYNNGGAISAATKANLSDVLVASPHSRARGIKSRFDDGGKIAVYDPNITSNPARIDPNVVKVRELQGAED